MAFFSCIPLALMMLLTGPIFRSFNFDPECIEYAQTYTQMLIPMLFFQS
jgi:Na+-driven multidrug efflux pump